MKVRLFGSQRNLIHHHTTSCDLNMMMPLQNKLCFGCGKEVYSHEKMVLNNETFHRTGCAKCNVCSKSLNATNFAVGGKTWFCKVHYKEAFERSGGKYPGEEFSPKESWKTTLLKLSELKVDTSVKTNRLSKQPILNQPPQFSVKKQDKIPSPDTNINPLPKQLTLNQEQRISVKKQEAKISTPEAIVSPKQQQPALLNQQQRISVKTQEPKPLTRKSTEEVGKVHQRNSMKQKQLVRTPFFIDREKLKPVPGNTETCLLPKNTNDTKSNAQKVFSNSVIITNQTPQSSSSTLTPIMNMDSFSDLKNQILKYVENLFETVKKQFPVDDLQRKFEQVTHMIESVQSYPMYLEVMKKIETIRRSLQSNQ